MKIKTGNPLLLFLIGLSVLSFPAAAVSAEWTDGWVSGQEGFDKVFQSSQTNRQPFVVYFYAVWCPYCKAFQKKVLSTEKFQKAFADIPKVRADVEKNEELAARFNIDSFPRIFIFFSEKHIQEVPASDDPARFIENVRRTGLTIKS